MIVTPKSDLISIPQLVRFVKSFFSKTFQTQLWIICFADDLFIISLSNDFVKYFLNFFQKNFWKLVFQSPKTSFWKGFRPTALLLYHHFSEKSSKISGIISNTFCVYLLKAVKKYKKSRNNSFGINWIPRLLPQYYGADYEARTRYLHLGKVALYQMS